MTVDFGDVRIKRLVEQQALWPEAELQGLVDESMERLRAGLSGSNAKEVWLAVGGLGLRQELNLHHSVYRRPDPAATRRALSTLCHAFHLARWGLYATVPDLGALQGRMEVLCNHGMLSFWLGHRPALELACKELAHFVPSEEQQLGSLDTAHLNFCIELCNTQAIVPAIPLLADPDRDAMYLALPFPKDDSAVSLQAIQAVLDQRIQRSYGMEEEGMGAYFYYGAYRSIFPFEVLAYYRWFKERGQLSADVALHPMLEYFDQFRYDPSVESEPIFVEVKKFIESWCVR